MGGGENDIKHLAKRFLRAHLSALKTEGLHCNKTFRCVTGKKKASGSFLKIQNSRLISLPLYTTRLYNET